MVRICSLLVLILSVLPAMEVQLELPNPAVVNAPLRGQVRLVNPEARVVDYRIEAVEGVELRIHTNQQSQSTRIVNNQRTSIISYPVSARFTSLGPTQVPTVVFVTDDGREFRSDEQSISVERPRDDLQGDIVCTIELDPPTIVPGQTCQLIYRVALNHGRQRWTIQDLDGAALPHEAMELGELRQEQGQAFDAAGNEWLLVTFRKDFTMVSPGSYRIGSQQRYGVEDRFGRFRPQGATPIRPATLTVTPLPIDGRPEDFSGLIGSVSLEAQLDRPRIAFGESARLTLILEGQRLELLDRIELPPLPGLQTYRRESENDEESGQRRFAWDLVPEAAGSYDIPALSVPWFDPDTASYARARSEPLQLLVIPGRSRGLEVAGRLPEEQANAEDAEPGLPEPIAERYRPEAGAKTVLIWLLAGCLLGLGCGLLGRLRARPQRRPGAAERVRQALASGDLAAANQALAELARQAGDEGQARRVRALLAAVEACRFGQGGDHDHLQRLAGELHEP